MNRPLPVMCSDVFPLLQGVCKTTDAADAHGMVPGPFAWSSVQHKSIIRLRRRVLQRGMERRIYLYIYIYILYVFISLLGPS